MKTLTASPLLPTARAFAACAVSTVRLLASRRLRFPRLMVGRRVVFADGSNFGVYRETVRMAPSRDPVVLVVRFRLRVLGRSRLGHAVFRAESILNTPLFAGFAGFRTKLWLTDELTGEYRGLYDWDGPAQAERYATTLVALLRLVSVPGSVAFHIEPGRTRNSYLQQLPSSRDARWWEPAEQRA